MSVVTVHPLQEKNRLTLLETEKKMGKFASKKIYKINFEALRNYPIMKAYVPAVIIIQDGKKVDAASLVSSQEAILVEVNPVYHSAEIHIYQP